MIVEFIGASGAGKTTLARAVNEGAGRSDVSLAWDLILDRPGLRRITHPTARNLLAEGLTLPALAGGWRRHHPFLSFSRQRLGKYSRSRFERLNYLRSILRKVGMHEFARRHDRRVVLADEGTVLTAYYLFVYVNSGFDADELDRFASLVPLPDRIVYVRAPLATLVDRSLLRSDRRRELVAVSRGELERWIGRATAVFDHLVTVPPIRERATVVDNLDGDPSSLAKLLGGMIFSPSASSGV